MRKNPIINTATTLGKLIGFLAVSVLCGVLVAGLVVPVTALGGSTVSNSITAFDNLPAELQVGAPQGVTNIYASDGTTVIARLFNQNRVEVGIDQMSPNIKNAVVAIEDSRYYEHGGVDPTGILRAAVSLFSKGGRQGASTITQQYVNNVIIQNLEAAGKGDQAKLGGDKTAGDKIREMKLAIAVEKQYSKQDILKGYLNIVNFANGTYGIQAASQFYFGINATDLTLAQGALLAGVVNSPSFYDPVKNPDNAKSRRDQVLDRMLQLKMVNQADHDAAIATPVAVTPHPKPQGCATASMAPFFCDYVLRTFLNNPDYGATEADRAQLLYQGGLSIKTTLDPNAQKITQDLEDQTSSPDDIQRLNRGSAMVSVEPGTGKILTMAQNFKMSDQAANGQTSYNFSVPKTDLDGNSLNGLGTMQVGSTMKPFTFAAWLQAGKSMNATVDGSQRRYPAGYPWKNSCGTTSSNYAGTADNPLLSNDSLRDYNNWNVLDGLVSSINTVTFAAAAQLDFCNIKKITEAAGILTGDTRKPLSFEYASDLLGSNSIDPLTMANAFATFANKGTYCSPIAIASVSDPSGKQLPVPSANCKSTFITPDVAAGMLYAMQQVFARRDGSGSLINPNLRAFQSTANIGGKTGTTTGNQDTWVVGTTSGIATASWFGNPTGSLSDNYVNQGVTINGVPYAQLDGANIAGTAFSKLMQQVAPNYNKAAFPTPPAKMVNGTPPPAPPKQNTSPSSPPASPPANTPAPPADGGTKP